VTIVCIKLRKLCSKSGARSSRVYRKARNFRVIQMFVDFAGAFPRRLNISPFTYKLYGNQCLNHEHLYHENYKFSYFSPIHENLANSYHENFLPYGSFQTACCCGLLQLASARTVGSSRRVSSDAATQIFAKVSNFSFVATKKRSASL